MVYHQLELFFHNSLINTELNLDSSDFIIPYNRLMRLIVSPETQPVWTMHHKNISPHPQFPLHRTQLESVPRASVTRMMLNTSNIPVQNTGTRTDKYLGTVQRKATLIGLVIHPCWTTYVSAGTRYCVTSAVASVAQKTIVIDQQPPVPS